MTDRIGIDKLIAFQSATAKYTGKPEDAAILATLRDYKRIMEAKVPEPVAWRWRRKTVEGWHCVEDKPKFFEDEFQFIVSPLCDLDLLRRETAKNERIMELLREPSYDVVTNCARRMLQWQDNCTDESFDKLIWAGARTDARRVIAELYAEVEKDK